MIYPLTATLPSGRLDGQPGARTIAFGRDVEGVQTGGAVDGAFVETGVAGTGTATDEVDWELTRQYADSPECRAYNPGGPLAREMDFLTRIGSTDVALSLDAANDAEMEDEPPDDALF